MTVRQQFIQTKLQSMKIQIKALQYFMVNIMNVHVVLSTPHCAKDVFPVFVFPIGLQCTFPSSTRQLFSHLWISPVR